MDDNTGGEAATTTTSLGTDKSNAASDGDPRPVCAHYEPDRKVFWLSRKRGKSLCSGGFGIVLSKVWPAVAEDSAVLAPLKEEEEKEGDDKVSMETLLQENGVLDPTTKTTSEKASMETSFQENGTSDPTTTTTTTTSEEYLRIEEVLFLHERGVLDATDEQNTPLDSRQLYHYLNMVNMPLQVYLAYAHLRQQSFRVVRHCPERRRLILSMLEEEQKQKQQKLEQQATNTSTTTAKKEAMVEDEHDELTNEKDDLLGENDDRGPVGKEGVVVSRRLSVWEQLKRELRMVTGRSQAPSLEDLPCLAWDVYPPDQSFSRTAPGLPLFSTLVTSYSQPTLPFAKIVQSIQENHPIPIKIATVSDSGIVVLFGISSDGVPQLKKQFANEGS